MEQSQAFINIKGLRWDSNPRNNSLYRASFAISATQSINLFILFLLLISKQGKQKKPFFIWRWAKHTPQRRVYKYRGLNRFHVRVHLAQYPKNPYILNIEPVVLARSNSTQALPLQHPPHPNTPFRWTCDSSAPRDSESDLPCGRFRESSGFGRWFHAYLNAPIPWNPFIWKTWAFYMFLVCCDEKLNGRMSWKPFNIDTHFQSKGQKTQWFRELNGFQDIRPFNGTSGNRTLNHSVKSRVLYQLS